MTRRAKNWPTWFPFVGWLTIDANEALEYDLPLRTKWRIFVVEWFGFGVTILAEPE